MNKTFKNNFSGHQLFTWLCLFMRLSRCPFVTETFTLLFVCSLSHFKLDLKLDWSKCQTPKCQCCLSLFRHFLILEHFDDWRPLWADILKGLFKHIYIKNGQIKCFYFYLLGWGLGSDVIINMLNFARFMFADCACKFWTSPMMMLPMYFCQNFDLKRAFFNRKSMKS